MKSSQYKELAELLFPAEAVDPKYLKLRAKKNGYRIAPSPTGYVHIGTIGMALVNSYLAKAAKGVFYLRIEDTDDKRYVDDAIDDMMQTFDYFKIKFDKGFMQKDDTADCYRQSQRTKIYNTLAKKLVEEGKAYPCFCGEQELARTREEQEKNKEKTGYYGKYASCRGLELEEIKQRIKAGGPGCWCLRADFSKGDWGERISFYDEVKGNISLPAETNDPIILKSNGIPPYNFAHVVDDTLMGTVKVVRGEEWLISTAQHIQLCRLAGLDCFQYAHMPTINIEEDGKKRKLSKRKDRMALAMALIADGYPADAVKEYLLTIYNTDFELWRLANPNADLGDFHFRIEKIGSNNPLFDLPKLNDISKNVLAKKSCEEIKRDFDTWRDGHGILFNLIAKFNSHNPPPTLLPTEEARLKAMLCVERGGERPRKDLAKLGDVWTLYNYVLEGFKADKKWTKEEKELLLKYSDIYDEKDDKETWWNKIKSMAAERGIKPGVIAALIRFALTGKENTPDLWTICQILENETVKKRLRLSK